MATPKPFRTRRQYSLPRALLLALALAPLPAAAAEPETAGRERIEQAAREIIREARYCSLITVGADGHPQARAMDPFPPEADFTVWLATHADSRKAAEIRADPRVTLYWFHPRATGYVTLHGTAEAVTDPKEKARRWKPKWASHYADGHRGEDYLLLKVRPRRLEVLSYPHGVGGAQAAHGPATLDLAP